MSPNPMAILSKPKTQIIYSLTPSPALMRSYQHEKNACPTPRYIIARERANAKKLAILMRKLHDKRIAHFESYKNLSTASNDKASLQLFNEVFKMSERLGENLSNPCNSKVESFETLYTFVTDLAKKFKDGFATATEFVTTNLSNIISAVKSFCSTARNIWQFASSTHDFISQTIGYSDLLYVFGFFIIYCLLALTPFESLGRAIFLAGMMFSQNEYISQAAKFLSVISATWIVSHWFVPKVNVNINQSIAHVQSFGEHPFVGISFVVVALICGMSTFTFNEQTYLSFVKRIEAHSKLITSASKLSECFSNVFSTMLTQFGMQFCGFGENESIPNDVKNIIEKLKTFDMEKRAEMMNKPEISTEVEVMYNNYMAMRINYRSNRSIVQILDKIQAPIVNLYQRACNLHGASLKNRIEPVVLMLTGGSGVGKSSILYHIGSAVLAHAKKITPDMSDAQIREAIDNCLYARMHEQEYWDRYQDQAVTLIDDFGQVKDTTSNPNVEFMELIRMSNPFPYPLHMADIESKKTATFTSKCVVATTNLSILKPTSLVSQSAVCRRVDMPFEVSLKEEYSDQFGRLRDEFKTGTINLDVYEFRSWNTMNGSIGEEVIGFKDLMKMLITKLQMKKDKYHKQKEGLADFARQMMAEVEGWSWFKTKREVYPQHTHEVCDRMEERYINAVYHNPEKNEYDELWEVLREDYEFEDCIQEFVEQTSGMITMEDNKTCYEICSSVFTWIKEQDEKYRIVDSVVILISVFLIGISAYNLYKSFSNDQEDYEVESGKSRLNKAQMKIESGKSRINKSQVKIESGKSRLNKQQVRIESGKSRMNKAQFKYEYGQQPIDVQTEDWFSNPIVTRRIKWNNLLIKAINHVENLELDEEEKMDFLKSAIPPWTVFAKMEDEDIDKIDITKQAFCNKYEGWVSSNASDLNLKIRSNMAKILWLDDNNNILNGNSPLRIFFPVGRTFIINAHYVRLMDRMMEQRSNFKIRICSSFSSEGIDYFWKDIRKDVKDYLRAGQMTDLCVVQLDKKCMRYPDLRKHVMEKSQLVNLVGVRVVSTVADCANVNYETKFGNVENLTMQETVDTDGSRFICQSATTNIGSREGDCGSVYIMDSLINARRICGIHFAGCAGKACFVPLVFEDLDAIIDEGEQLSPQFTTVEDIPNAIVQGNCISLGAILDPPYPNTRTKIHATRVFNKIYPSEMAPAKLMHPEQEDGPMYKGIQKQFRNVPILDQEILKKSVLSYKQQLAKSKCNYRKMQVLSFDEAVKGTDSEYIKGINRVTSAGYPWCHEKSKGKTLWFGNMEWDLHGKKAKEVRKKVMSQIESMKQGIVQPYIFTDTLKDETLPKLKVEIGKTRVFAAAPMDFVIVFRMYFISFIAFLMEKRIDTESAVGIRCQSLEWDKLAKHLMKFGEKHVAGDFSNYDGTLHPDILWAILEVIEEYYEKSPDYSLEDKLVRHCLWESIVNSYHICGKYIYKLNHSQPSGNPATAILNSMYNSIACRVTFYTERPGKEEFNDSVSMIAYGDDNLLNISSRVSGWFNQESMTRAFATFGMIYTDEEKTGQMTGFKQLEQCYFLKRGFSFDSNYRVWMAPLKLPSIMECFNWIHGSTFEETVIGQNARAAFAELALHDQEQFEQYSRKIKIVCAEVYNMTLINHEYEDYRMMVRDETLLNNFPELNWA